MRVRVPIRYSCNVVVVQLHQYICWPREIRSLWGRRNKLACHINSMLNVFFTCRLSSHVVGFVKWDLSQVQSLTVFCHCYSVMNVQKLLLSCFNSHQSFVFPLFDAKFQARLLKSWWMYFYFGKGRKGKFVKIQTCVCDVVPQVEWMTDAVSNHNSALWVLYDGLDEGWH